MKPYYQDECMTIYNMNCLGAMKSLGNQIISLVLTDPPYNAKNIGPNQRVYDNQPMQMTETEYRYFCRSWFQEARAISSRMVFTPGISNICFYPQPYWVLCWHKPAAVSFNRMGGYNAWEPIMVYAKPAAGQRLTQDYLLYNTLNLAKGPEKDHPCPKPLSLMRFLVKTFTSENDVILDPFLGSGTTARAAKDLGRKCIGFEISEAYCKIAEKRLAQQVFNYVP